MRKSEREYSFNESINRTMSGILEVAEAAFGTTPHWQFFRKTLLKRLNDLKREVESNFK